MNVARTLVQKAHFASMELITSPAPAHLVTMATLMNRAKNVEVSVKDPI